MIGLEERRVATEATLALYRGKPFSWAKGITCVHLARRHLKHCGHRPPTVPRIRSALAARRALAANGWDSVADMLDTLLPRIAPAQMLPGDLAMLEGESTGEAGGGNKSGGALGAIVICAGPRKLFGWREDADGLVVLDVDPALIAGAWRV